MYSPEWSQVKDPKVLGDFLRTHNFGLLVSSEKETMEASHLPFLYEASEGEKGTLYTHLARNNPQWRSLEKDKKVLVIFSGPQGYISPLWYQSQPSVPTWNYAAVHFYAIPELIQEKDRIQNLLEKTVAFYEKTNGTDWKADFTGDYHSKLAEAIVGVQLKVVETQVKFKLSQNKSLEDRKKVIESLRDRKSPGSKDLAAWMEKALKPSPEPKKEAS